MKTLTFILIFFLQSCATDSQRKGRYALNSMGVDVQSNGQIQDKLLPKIENNQNEKNSVGPFPENNNDSYLTNKKKSNKAVIGLILGPGINRVLCHIPILKELETQGRRIHIITGTGLGALVASMYATGISPDKIEWIFFNFSRKVENLKPFSKEWIKIARDVLLKTFKNKKIQSAKIRLAIPKYKKSKRKVEYITRGQMYDLLLKEHLSFNSLNNLGSFAPFQKEIFNQTELQKLGADKTIAVDVLDNKIDFETTDHYLTGVFGRITGIIRREKETIDLFVTMNSLGMPLDSTKGLPEYLQKCMVKSRDVVQNIKAVLEESIK
ncbi:MAG: hypothetical protein HN576_04290 [Bacteriovoracaceae bacterium]|jgi:hypothetical protein|nr:hypothetical protein [Bacteriovoracaceae bacterium]